jgi:hypothetical protein
MFPFLVGSTNIPAFNPSSEVEQDSRVKKLSRSNTYKAQVVVTAFQVLRGLLLSWWSSSTWHRVDLNFDTHGL